MSAVKTSEQYKVLHRSPSGFKVVARSKPFSAVDVFITRSAAEYAAKLLNNGLASVDPHAVIGCKVVAR